MDQAASSRTNVLHRIEIPSPCTASWDKMTGSETVRHCGDCNKSVFNLSAMPEAQAAALIAENAGGELCVRFYRRADGTVMTSDCGTSARAATRRTLRKLPGLAGSALLAVSLAACGAADAVSAGPDGTPVKTQADVAPPEATAGLAFIPVMGEPAVPPPSPETESSTAQVESTDTLPIIMGKPMAPREQDKSAILRGETTDKRKD